MHAPTAKPRAYSYLRFSTPEQLEGDSLRRQVAAAKEYAARNNLILDDELTFRDLGVSAFRGRNAQTGALRVFLDAVEQGDIPQGSYLLVENLDRISRDQILTAQGLFSQIIGAGITLVTLQDGKAYSKENVNANPTDLILAILSMIRAHEESATKSKRLTAVYEQKRKRAATKSEGKPFSRMLPAWLFWDDKVSKHKVYPERAKVVHDIFRKFLAGWGQHRIAHWLNDRGVPTWGSGKSKAQYWHRSYVKKILTNPAVIGTFTPHRALRDSITGARRRKPQEPIEGYFPTVIDKVVFDQAALKFGTTAPRGRHANSEPKSLFSGVLTCSQCGATVSRVSKGKWVYLVCAKANSKANGAHRYQAVSYADVEGRFRELASAIVEEAPRGKDTVEIESQIEIYNAHIGELEYEAREIADELVTNRSDTLRRKLREIEDQLGQRRDELQQLIARREMSTRANVQRRLKALQDALEQEPFNVAQANRALRQAVRKIVMDVERGRLLIDWQHTEQDASTQDIYFVSKHWQPTD